MRKVRSQAGSSKYTTVTTIAITITRTIGITIIIGHIIIGIITGIIIGPIIIDPTVGTITITERSGEAVSALHPDQGEWRANDACRCPTLIYPADCSSCVQTPHSSVRRWSASDW